MRATTLPQLSIAVRQRGDLSGQQNAFGQNASDNITDSEMTTVLNASIAEVWDILTSNYGDFYAWGDGGTGSGQGYLLPIQQGVYKYALPWDFYKMNGVDLALDTTGINWASVRPYTLRDRNLFSFPLQTALAYAGWQNFRYQIQGNYIGFLPQQGPLPGQVRLLYTPQAPTLVQTLPVSYPSLTSVPQGYQVQASVTLAGIATVQVFTSQNSGTTGASAPTWAVPGTVTDSGGVVWAYTAPLNSFATTFDGINGYEDLVVLDATIKFLLKQEADVSGFMAQKEAWIARIVKDSANRNSGDPMVISGGFGTAEGGPSYGNGFGFGVGGWF